MVRKIFGKIGTQAQQKRPTTVAVSPGRGKATAQRRARAAVNNQPIGAKSLASFYTNSFGDGKLYKVSLNPNGRLAKQETLTLRGKQIPCVDGLIIDRATDKMDLCNSRENSIEIVDLRNGNQVTTLAQNPDTNGTDGQLDQPAKVLLKGKRLYISDFDPSVKYFANTKSDAPHTQSVIDLQ